MNRPIAFGKPHNAKDALLRRTMVAAGRYAQARRDLEGRADPTARPGDLYAFEPTGESAVLWAIIEEDGRLRPKRFLLVAADLNPLVGSADVATPEEAPCGAMTLRGKVAVWVEAADLATAKCVGLVSPQALEEIRQKRAAVEMSRPAFEAETDAEVEYQEWLEELGRVQASVSAALAARAGTTEAESGAVENLDDGRGEATKTADVEVRPRLGRFLGRAGSSRYSLAATILLMLGLGSGLYLQHQKIRDLETAGQAPSPNVVPIWLFPHFGERSEATIDDETLRERANFVLALSVEALLREYPEYELKIRHRSTGSEVLAVGDLHEIRGLVSVEMPTDLLPAGEYWIDLYGLTNAKAEPVAQYVLRLETE